MVKAAPFGCATLCQRRSSGASPPCRQRCSSRSKESASARANSSRVGAGPPSASAAVRRPATSGACRMLTPTPTTTTPWIISRRIPAAFPPLNRRSFGHFNINPSGANRAAVSWTATPLSSASEAGAGSAEVTRTTVDPMKLPASPFHERPRRPRPAVCRSATSQCPSGTRFPAARRPDSSAFVEPVSAITSIKALGTERSPPCR